MSADVYKKNEHLVDFVDLTAGCTNFCSDCPIRAAVIFVFLRLFPKNL